MVLQQMSTMIYIDLLLLLLARIITFLTALEGIVPMSLASNITHR